MSRIATLGIFAPAASLKDGEQEYLHAGIKTLEDLGLRIIKANNLEEREELFAGAGTWHPGSATRRIDEMMRLWSDTRVDALLSLRGGYGCVHLLDKLDYDYIAARPKPIIGYSDLTVLFLALAAKSYPGSANKRYQFFHAPMLCELSRLTETQMRSWIKMSERIDPDLYAQGCLRVPAACEHACSRVMGGNLSLIASLIGTEYEMSKSNEILFLEDCKEDAYKIERYLRQLEMAGYFANIQELWMGAPLETAYNYAYLEELSRKNSFKLVRDLPYGHKGKYSLVLN